MVDVFVGQTGRAVLNLVAADGRETKVFDTVTGITYTSRDPAVATIVDTDAEPQDAEISAIGVGSTAFTCTLDGDPSEEVNQLTFESEEVNVAEPPPGMAVGGTFEVQFNPVTP